MTVIKWRREMKITKSKLIAISRVQRNRLGLTPGEAYWTRARTGRLTAHRVAR